jgi:hypothetical protein
VPVGTAIAARCNLLSQPIGANRYIIHDSHFEIAVVKFACGIRGESGQRFVISNILRFCNLVLFRVALNF